MSWGTDAPPDSLYSLWYYPDINRFVDEDGTIIHNLSDKFHVWELEEWKKTLDYGILRDRNGDLWELFCPDYPTGKRERYPYRNGLVDIVSNFFRGR